MQVSPMMQQYFEIKEQHKDCILFFRLGDFYEMFFEDAHLTSRELELTLTGKNYGQEERAPMCGVPYHSADAYIARLVEKGYKVAICEQVEDPATVKGLVRREVVRIVTPGTVINQSMLSEKENNYLASCCHTAEAIGFAYCDISTGELYVTQLQGEGRDETLFNEFVKIKAREILLSKELAEEIQYKDAYLNPLDASRFDFRNAENAILHHFDVISLAGLGLAEKEAAACALGALLSYLLETQKQSLIHMKALSFYEIGNHMALDMATIRNLEITETLFGKKAQGSLLSILDKTHTAMGGRKMKQWLREPLNRTEEINARLSAVEILLEEVLLRNHLKEGLKRIYDLERLCGRIACGNANGRDLLALASSLFALPGIKEDLTDCESPLLSELESQMGEFGEIVELISRAISEEAPYTVKEGGLIKPGYAEELDALKFSIKDGQLWIAGLEAKERERTGIKNLKVGFNRVFGYYIEITKSYYDLIPDNYIRKQTLVNCERFITPELKEMESLVLGAETKINQKEYELFTEIRGFVQGFTAEIQRTSAAISSLDVLVSFAEVSQKLGYVKPEMHDGQEILIQAGRHPVIEQTIKDGRFVSNDTYVNEKDASLLLITGPNMAGKSTYMRQTALIVLMAQAGCFVPCERASIGVVDRIFTRIGASDNLSQGQSTFFVEMSELAYILNFATGKSLIILDEIGRGTSTYDGLSIAWAAAEALCSEKTRIRTLFATHYHELTVLEGHLEGFRNLNVEVAEEGGNVVFLHKIAVGSASRSYGIHVAKLAGVPKPVLARAEAKLAELEAVSQTAEVQSFQSEKEHDTVQEEQISFFSFAPNPVVERLLALNLMDIKPSEAFQILEELKEAAK